MTVHQLNVVAFKLISQPNQSSQHSTTNHDQQSVRHGSPNMGTIVVEIIDYVNDMVICNFYVEGWKISRLILVYDKKLS